MADLTDKEMGDGCSKHPYAKSPGGICGFCLQEKLGKLVSSPSPLPKHVSSSSSSSPSFRSASVGSSVSVAGSLSLSLSANAANSTGNEGCRYHESNEGKVSQKSPFLLENKKKKMLAASMATRTDTNVYKRSNSTTNTRTVYGRDFSPRKRSGFWSFLHLYSSKHHSSSNNNNSKPSENALSKLDKNEGRTNQTETRSSSSLSSTNRNPNVVVAETPGRRDNGCGGNLSSERKVSRSRSVGCGSRSFSSDLFERISNGFGDCTLRRIESHREGVNKAKVGRNPSNGGGAWVRDMVRCRGIFGGFMIMTSSSSSSSLSASSWVSSSSSAGDHHNVHGKSRSWGWALASPMRAFTSSGKDGTGGRTITESTSKNTAPNLDAIPSLLTAKS